MKARVGGILFLLVLIVPVLSTLCFLSYQKHQVRRQVKRQIIAGISKDQLVLLKFTQQDSANLEWKHAKEFKYQGYFYDIVEKEHHNDTTYFWCWWDYEETQLSKQLENVFVHAFAKNRAASKSKSAFYTFYSKLFAEEFFEFKYRQFSVVKKHIYRYLHSILSHQSEPPTPPPDFIFHS